MSALDLARPELRRLKPYSSARMESHGGSVHLDANESPWPPFDAGTDWNRYPAPQPLQLVERLAGLHAVAPAQVLVGRGSDEGIDLMVRAFCRAGRDAILVSPPTFGMYAACARIQGARVVEAPLRDDFSPDVGGMLAALTPEVKLVFVCAPNNPGGVGIARDDILRLARALTGRALLVVDEAYIEFVDPDGACGSVAGHVGTLENLVVLRTLSKAHALAGARVGVLLAAAPVVTLLRTIMPPYPVPAPCAAAALRALSDAGQRATRARVELIRAERRRMRAALVRLPCVRDVLPSEANFLAVRFHAAGEALAALAGCGIVVRDVRHCRMLRDALRITIGSRDENDRVLAALAATGARAIDAAAADVETAR